MGCIACISVIRGPWLGPLRAQGRPGRAKGLPLTPPGSRRVNLYKNTLCWASDPEPAAQPRPFWAVRDVALYPLELCVVPGRVLSARWRLGEADSHNLYIFIPKKRAILGQKSKGARLCCDCGL